MKPFKLVLAILVLITTILAACEEQSQATYQNNKTTTASDTTVERGQYLVTILGCNDCHSPKIMGPQGPQPDPDRLFSGHPAHERIGKVDTSAVRNWTLFNFHNTAVVGPWGVSYAANLTSDETGIGKWSQQQFLTAMKKGKFKGLENSRPLLPPMPWFNYTNATDEDIIAIYNFLKTTKPVQNMVPAPASLAQLNQK